MADTLINLNGVSALLDEPYPFLDQAHALALLARQAMLYADAGTPNSEVLAGAFDAIATLVQLAATGVDRMVDTMNAKRETRRG